MRGTIFSILCLLVAQATAQGTPQADPRDALKIPTTGVVRAGQGKRVEVRDRDGRSRVALVQVEVGDRQLAILPNGRIDSFAASAVKPTSEPFRAATKEQIAAELKEAGFADFKTRSTARYLYIYNTSEEFCKGTSRILETMYPSIVAYFKRHQFPVHEPTTPLVAIMFRTDAEFQAYASVPTGIAAYYHTISNHIVMYEQSKLVEVAPELAVKQSIGTIAHEGIHQILHNIGVQQRLSRWPLWTTEGLAEYFAPTSVDHRLRWKGVGMPHDLRMHELEQLWKQASDSQGKVVEQTVAAARLTSAGYTTAWGLTHYLATRQPKKFIAYLRDVSKLGPLEPLEPTLNTASQKKLFNEHFGSDYAAIEKAMIKHLEKLPYIDPIANQTHYVVMLDTATVRTAGVTSSPTAVRQWQEETLANVPAAVRAQAAFRIMPFGNKAAAEEYAARWLQGK